MAALRHEEREDGDRGRALGDEGGDRLLESGRHELEVGERDRVLGAARAHAIADLLEGPRPLRVARAVGEEDDAAH